MPKGANVVPNNKTQDILSNNSSNITVNLNVSGNVLGNHEFFNEMMNLMAIEIRKACSLNIIISDVSGVSSLVFPIVPVDTQIGANGQSETVNTLDGRFRIIKNKDLKTISWSSLNKSYNFVKRGSLANGWLYVTFLEMIKKYKLPVRTIITTNENKPILNILTSIDNFSYNIDKTGDINYSISLTEFPYTLMEFLSRWEKSRNWSMDIAGNIETVKDNTLNGIKAGWQKMCGASKQKATLIKAGILKGD